MGPGRYDELFESMKPGQCIKCEPEHMREVYDTSMALKLMAKDNHRNYPTREELINFGKILD